MPGRASPVAATCGMLGWQRQCWGAQVIPASLTGHHRITIHSSRTGFARRLNSGVRPRIMQPGEPLKYPPHFPPSTKWKRFFIGVRWLGPDMSFLKDLRSAQSSRTAASMSVWGGGDRQALAASVGTAFSMYCGWPTPHFLPIDNVSVIAGGPRFGALDDTDVLDAIGAIEEIADTRMGAAFWEACGSDTLGELVDQLLAAAGPNNSFKPNPLRGSA